jgi:O-antigen/teichoic acid export membrane protein
VAVPIALVVQSVILSTFPAICRRYDAGEEGLTRATRQLCVVLVSIALPAAVAGSFAADDVLSLLYGGGDFAGAGVVLTITLWQGVLVALTSVLGHVLYAGLRERLTLRIVAVDTVATVVAGVLLIRWFGVVGAALGSLAVATLELAQHYRPVARSLTTLSLGRAVWRPALAAVAVTAALAAFAAPGLLVPLLAAPAGYALALLVLVVRPRRDLDGLTVDYRGLWST